MGLKVNFILAALLGSALYALRGPIRRYMSLEPGQEFAVAWTTHNSTTENLQYFSRSRRSDYTDFDSFFFQWWNYVIVDAETGYNFNFAYQITDYPSTAPGEVDSATVTMGIKRGAKSVTSGAVEYPQSYTTETGHGHVSIYASPEAAAAAKEGKTPAPVPVHSHRFLDDNTVHMTANYPASVTNDSKPLQWDLTFTKVHGVFTAEDNEAANDRSVCGIGGSSLYGYDSLVRGWVYAAGINHTFTHTNRFRGYGAGSWGCTVPRGEPAIEHPWAWLWVVVPGATPADDLSVEFGNGRAATHNAGSIFGNTGVVGGYLPDGKIWDARNVYLWDKGPSGRGLLFQASSSDGGVNELSITQHDWQNFTDEHGTALLPTRQVFTMETLDNRIVVNCTAPVSQFFRATIKIYNPELKDRVVFSDFRAVGVHAHIQIFRKVKRTAPNTALLAWATGKKEVTVGVEYEKVRDVVSKDFNAMEYAYRAAFDESHAPLRITRMDKEPAHKDEL